jgi:hypothetical protein
MEKMIAPTFQLVLSGVIVKEGSFDDVWEHLEEKSRLTHVGILHLLTFHGYNLVDLRDPVTSSRQNW